MKLNERLGMFNSSPLLANPIPNLIPALSTSKVLMVPYSEHHVPEYHFWMQDPDLQSATASEPLTLEEEYAMQRIWRTDRDKLTFIVCLPISSTEGVEALEAGQCDSSDRMIGDINLFLFDNEDEENPSESNGSVLSSGIVGEIELMIARKDLHRQGYGRATLLAFTTYVLSSWDQLAKEYSGNSTPPLAYLRVKINQDNHRSIALFQSVGFAMIGEGPNYFGEVELRFNARTDQLDALPGFELPKRLKYEVGS